MSINKHSKSDALAVIQCSPSKIPYKGIFLIRENARASITLCEVFIAGANHAHIYFAYVKTP